MVQLEKVLGQRGHMVVHEDGSIISSSGELSSSESTSHQILSLLSHSLPVDFNSAGPVNGTHSENETSGGVGDNGNGNLDHSALSGAVNNPTALGINGGSHIGDNQNNQSGQVWKWNRITVDFGDHSFVACLSNKRIHLVKRDNCHSDIEHSTNSQGPQ